MATKGYHSYRGRRSWWKKLVVALLVLILLAACGFMLIQRYITYTDDGRLWLDLPFLRQEETLPPAPLPEEQEEMNLVITPPAQPEPEPEPEPETPVQTARRVAELSVLPADGEALRAALDELGANAFAFQVKNSAGQVRCASEMAMDDAVAEDAVDLATLAALCAREDVDAVARLNCFHDSYYAWAHMESAGVCQSTGYIWYDNNSWHWLDPAKEAARQYVIALALECAQLGFDELLLEEASYPVKGNLQKIDYTGNTMGKTEALKLFLTELRAAVEPYGVKISLLLDSQLLTAEGEALAETSGQDLKVLLPLVDAVYAQVEDLAAAEAVLAQAAGDEAAPPLIPLMESPGEGERWYMAQ